MSWEDLQANAVVATMGELTRQRGDLLRKIEMLRPVSACGSTVDGTRGRAYLDLCNTNQRLDVVQAEITGRLAAHARGYQRVR